MGVSGFEEGTDWLARDEDVEGFRVEDGGDVLRGARLDEVFAAKSKVEELWYMNMVIPEVFLL